MPDIGHPAPDFTLPRDGGALVTLSDMRPKAVVLYFYPKDSTPGCTKQALAFSAHVDAFAGANACVIGVSKDTVKSHETFIAKNALDIVLVSDTGGKVCEAYGTWVEKSMYGKTYMGIERATYLIDGLGIVRQIWRKVKVAGHAEAVLAAVREL